MSLSMFGTNLYAQLAVINKTWPKCWGKKMRAGFSELSWIFVKEALLVG